MHQPVSNCVGCPSARPSVRPSVCVCHLLPREGTSFFICPWISITRSLSAFCSLLYCLCHLLLYFSLCSLCHSVICFYQHHFSLAPLSCHTPTFPFALSDTLLHILLFSSSQCEEVSAPPYGLSRSSSESEGGVLHSNIGVKKRGEKSYVEWW